MLRLTARAKINWTLDILGTREDGYHWMDMLMSSVELADILELEPADALTLSISDAFSGESAALSPQGDESNLVFKAARLLHSMAGCGKGAHMRLTKRIPVGAGMGGGSADAAAALMGLCQLWGISLPESELMELALSLGADVPFMLVGGLARVGGIGERIEPLPFPLPHWLVLIQPCAGLSTPEIFRAFDEQPEKGALRPQTERARQALLSGDLQGLARAMGNVMEPVSLLRRPEMRDAIRALEAHGALRAIMTGSGSVVYGVFEAEETARKARERLGARWKKTYLTKTAGQGVSMEEA